MNCCASDNIKNTKECIVAAINNADLKKVESCLGDSCGSLNGDDIRDLTVIAEHKQRTLQSLERTLGEKILLYGCGTIATLYTLNLIAYSLSSYLQKAMFDAHGLAPHHVFPIAALLIGGFGLLAYKGWQGPKARLERAKAIKEALAGYARKCS